ncbi:hypothetical protein HYT23_00375 [Candidatus Pacearchaeota archaeon]|nr:hypothetical protein [Candidatus Pacearchaeota archaeon]
MNRLILPEEVIESTGVRSHKRKNIQHQIDEIEMRRWRMFYELITARRETKTDRDIYKMEREKFQRDYNFFRAVKSVGF